MAAGLGAEVTILDRSLPRLRQLDELYLKCPFFGSRKMAVELAANRKRIQRLMRILHCATPSRFHAAT